MRPGTAWRCRKRRQPQLRSRDWGEFPSRRPALANTWNWRWTSGAGLGCSQDTARGSESCWRIAERSLEQLPWHTSRRLRSSSLRPRPGVRGAGRRGGGTAASLTPEHSGTGDAGSRVTGEPLACAQRVFRPGP